LEVVEPAVLQTDEVLSADMAKAGIRAQLNLIGDQTVYTAQVKDSKAGPMFNWSWGYYSIFDADAILYDVFKCGEPWSYYCNKDLDELIVAGRSTLDQKKRAEIYTKAQTLLFEDAAYVFKWGLRGVWGISNRVNYEAPRDEIDRMWLVTPRKR
jgi:peptide/nickel transport system substrate-binding protein